MITPQIEKAALILPRVLSSPPPPHAGAERTRAAPDSPPIPKPPTLLNTDIPVREVSASAAPHLPEPPMSRNFNVALWPDTQAD